MFPVILDLTLCHLKSSPQQYNDNKNYWLDQIAKAPGLGAKVSLCWPEIYRSPKHSAKAKGFQCTENTKFTNTVPTYAGFSLYKYMWGFFCISWAFRTVPPIRILCKTILFKSQNPHNMGTLCKGQLISKYLFGVFSFLQKTSQPEVSY